MALPELHQQRELVQTKSSREDGGKKHGPISFGFSKTLHEFKSDKSEKREYLTAVEGKELKGTKSADKPKGLVIPLIHKNRWYHKDAGREDTTTEDQPRREASSEPDTVESQAVRELIEESQKLQDKWENGPQTDPNFAIPLLMQNQAPQGFEDGDLIKLDLRPESSTDTDYEHVPVEAYGMAMLKGMGWRAGEGIGRTLKQDVKPIENQLRPKGLGLGADRSAIKDLEPKRAKRPPKPGEERADEEEALVLGPGGCVLVLGGAHKDLYGKIEGVDADNARVVIKLAIGGKTVTVIQHSLKLVTQKEYGKYSKDLSRLSKAHKEKERDQTSNGRDQREKDRETRKKKHQESSPDRDKPPAAKEPRLSVQSWLQRDLRVRFIDKAFKDGRYYNSKMRVEDVLTPHTCVCRTDDGRVLDDIRQKMLETIVPKNDSDFIMVVLGEHRGQVGRILKREREKCRAMVQLDRHEEQVFTLDYDTICHYVGGTEH